MVSEKKVSIVIPTLNEETIIESLLKNLDACRKKWPLEIILVDGKSKDKTREIAMRYCDQVLVSEPGRGSQLNEGAKAATGDIILFLHADSIVDPQAFRLLLEAYDEGITGGCFVLKFDEEKFIYRVIAFFSNLRAKVLKSCYGDQGIFVTKDLFHMLGGFRNIPLMEDLEFSKRLRKQAKFKVINSKIITSSRRFKKGGALRTIILMQMLKIAFHLGVDPNLLAKIYRRG